MSSKINVVIPSIQLSRELIYCLEKLNNQTYKNFFVTIVLDFKNRTCYFSDTETQVSGILPKEELHFFLKFPWGADTLNITSCFEVLDDKKWRFLLEYKDSMYVR